MDPLPPPSSWFSPEEIKRHAEGVLIGLAAAFGVQKLGWIVTGDKAKLQADLAVAQDRLAQKDTDAAEARRKLAKAEKTIAEMDDEIDDMRREIARLRESVA